MPVGTADIILFGIQAGIRLYGQARQAYVENTREREFTMPLPGLDHTATVGQAQSYFLADPFGRKHLQESERVRELHAEVMADRAAFEADAARSNEYTGAFQYFRSVDSGAVTKDGFGASDVLALTTIAQWKRGEAPHPTALKRIAGTLVEIGIDYFANGPGAGTLSESSPAGKIVKRLLTELDDVSFVADGLEGVVKTLFVAALETLADDPQLLSADEKAQRFIGAVARGVVGDVNRYLESLPEEERLLTAKSLESMAGLLFRSVARNGVSHVLSNPAALLGTPEGGSSELVTRVGTAVLDLILPSAESPLDLSALFTADSLDKVVRAGLEVVVAHPEMLGIDADDKSALETILLEVADGILEDARKIGPDLFPELARLILERTAGNLNLLWDPESDLEHVLVTATRELLTTLATKPADGTAWAPKLGRKEVIDLAESLLDEVAANPGLVTNRIGGHTAIKLAVEATLTELAAIELDDLSIATVQSILKSVVIAVTTRRDFLDRFRGLDGVTRVAIGNVLHAVVSVVFAEDAAGSRAQWALARSSVLDAIITVSLDRLSEHGLDRARLTRLKEALDGIAQTLEERGSFSIDAFANLLDTSLRKAA